MNIMFMYFNWLAKVSRKIELQGKIIFSFI